MDAGDVRRLHPRFRAETSRTGAASNRQHDSNPPLARIRDGRCCLGIFMISAVAFAIVLQHPRSPLAGWTTLPPLARAPMGLAMGLTNVALIYSPAGRRSVRT